ncbi:hypothetical protein BsWGS_27421 [Bradybaena similaris]
MAAPYIAIMAVAGNDTATTDLTTLTTTIAGNTTSVPDISRPYPQYVGYIAAVIAVLVYGSNFVPIKKFYTGDGMFFQWVLCSGIFMVGVVVQLIQQSTFQPFAMLGGVFWATGNLCVVPIFKTIGMGLGMCTWSVFSLIVGWATGRFGLFGTDQDKISNSAMNYAGVALAFASILLYVLVKNEIGASSDVEIEVTDDVLIRANPANTNPDPRGTDDLMYIETLSPIKKRIIGTALGVFSGVMYGIQFTPATYIQQHKTGASKNGLDYAFVHFCGIYATSCVYLFLYCAIKGNKPKVYPEVILPGIVSGVMWGIACTCWFISNAELSEAVSYPIVGVAPAAIASLVWGVIIFREIKGMRNIIILVLAFCTMSAGVILAGLSR